MPASSTEAPTRRSTRIASQPAPASKPVTKAAPAKQKAAAPSKDKKPVTSKSPKRKAKDENTSSAEEEEEDEETKEGKTDKKAVAADKKKPVASAKGKKDDEKKDDEKPTEEAPEGDVSEAASTAKKPAAKKQKTEDEKTLKVGDSIPDNLEVHNQKNEKFKLLDLVKENGAVFFIYPKADTPGCTKQANGFKESEKEFKDKDYKIFGLSADKPAALEKWQTKLSLPYDLLSDETFAAIRLFGAYVEPKKITRSHVVVEKGGKIVDIKIKVSPSDSFEGACKFVKADK
ncbi:hypothetical protein HKX48_002055 [Thoreauomyces humboldtii]|nr:hypothetical protein HKX48_002055 [Thoreauomyces humboldtii]